MRATVDTLLGRWTPARRLVRAAVDGLAFGAPDRRPELLDLIIDRMGRVTPAGARVALLAGLTRVTGLDSRSVARLGELLPLLERAGHELPARDRTLLRLRVAEVERLSGHTARAARTLAVARTLLERPGSRFVRRAWWQALDRLGSAAAPDHAADLAADEVGISAEFHDFPMLCAAFLLERAEALRGTPDHAERLRRRAADLLARAGTPDRETQWHARERALAGELARRGWSRPWSGSARSARPGRRSPPSGIRCGPRSPRTRSCCPAARSSRTPGSA